MSANDDHISNNIVNTENQNESNIIFENSTRIITLLKTITDTNTHHTKNNHEYTNDNMYFWQVLEVVKVNIKCKKLIKFVIHNYKSIHKKRNQKRKNKIMHFM